MQVVQICKRIKETIDIEKELHGEVHSVYTRALNISLENDELITVLSNEKTIGPNSILLNKVVNFFELGVFQGTKVVISEEQIIIDNINIEFTISKGWNSTPQLAYSKALETDILDNLKLMENLIYEYGNLEGIAPVMFNIGKLNEDYELFTNINTKMNQYCIFIIHRLIKFLNNVSNIEIDKISDSTKNIIGFGPGLTPSMDDLISGLMVSLVYLSHHFDLDKNKVLNLNRNIVKGASNKTTRVSEEMLKFSSVGETTKTNRELIIALLSDSNEKEVTKKCIEVIKFGGTSGTDTLCGIYFGFKILLNKKNKEAYINGGQY